MKERRNRFPIGGATLKKIAAVLAMCLFLCFIESIVVYGVELLSFCLLNPALIRVCFWIGGLWGVFCCLRER